MARTPYGIRSGIAHHRADTRSVEQAVKKKKQVRRCSGNQNLRAICVVESPPCSVCGRSRLGRDQPERIESLALVHLKLREGNRPTLLVAGPNAGLLKRAYCAAAAPSIETRTRSSSELAPASLKSTTRSCTCSHMPAASKACRAPLFGSLERRLGRSAGAGSRCRM